MAKIIGYPRSSFKASMELAEAVYSLGGNCTKESCADEMGKKMSGGFTSIIGAAVKFELVQSKKGELLTSDLFNKIKLSYDEDEKKKYEKEAFLKPPVFQKLTEKLSGKTLPSYLDKFLIREFEVDKDRASRVAKYFIEGAKFVELFDNQGRIQLENNINDETVDEEYSDFEDVTSNNETINAVIPALSNKEKASTQILHIDNSITNSEKINAKSDEYIVHISGPGINSQIVIREEDDLDIVNAMLKKVKKKLQ